MLLKLVEFDQSLSIRGQKPGAVQLANVEGSVGRDGVSLPFRGKTTKPDEEPEELEALIPWTRIKQVVRVRETKK